MIISPPTEPGFFLHPHPHLPQSNIQHTEVISANHPHLNRITTRDGESSSTQTHHHFPHDSNNEPQNPKTFFFTDINPSSLLSSQTPQVLKIKINVPIPIYPTQTLQILKPLKPNQPIQKIQDSNSLPNPRLRPPPPNPRLETNNLRHALENPLLFSTRGRRGIAQ
jgi:hypothetical protein